MSIPCAPGIPGHRAAHVARHPGHAFQPGQAVFHAPDQQAGQLYARADPYEPQSAVLADHGGRFVHAAADEHNGQLAIGGEDIRPAAKHGHAPPDPIRRLGQRFQIRGAFKRGECQRPAPRCREVKEAMRGDATIRTIGFPLSRLFRRRTTLLNIIFYRELSPFT